MDSTNSSNKWPNTVKFNQNTIMQTYIKSNPFTYKKSAMKLILE